MFCSICSAAQKAHKIIYQYWTNMPPSLELEPCYSREMEEYVQACELLRTMLLFCLTLNVGFTTESAEVDNTWSRQDNYILCTHIKMETIQQNYIWKCISTVSHDKSSRNKERCGVNASCMLYSFKIVFPTRQVFSTSALSVVKPTFNVRQNNSIVGEGSYGLLKVPTN